MENQFPSSTPAGGIDPSTPGPGLVSGQEVGGGRFVLKQQLGQGGMGVVWLAFDKELNEHVALKFLPPAIHSDFGSIEDLRTELKRNRGLAHPNIVKVYDLHTVKGESVFFSMEYVDGPTLAKLRYDQSNRVLSWDMLSPWVGQLCEALDYAHGEKIVHRDLKPSNVMVDSKGRIKLADFGIARIVTDSVSRVTGSQGTSGTLIYMSPQQLDGKHPRPTDDIYALGATLYELLTSKAPFYSGDVAHQIRSLQPEPIERRLTDLGIDNTIPPQVQQTVAACLAKEPILRPQTAGLVAERLGLASLAPRYAGRSALASDSPQRVAIQDHTRFHAPTPRLQSEATTPSESSGRMSANSVEDHSQRPEMKSPPERKYRGVVVVMVLLVLVVMGGIFHRGIQTWIWIGSGGSGSTRTSAPPRLTNGVVIVRADPVDSRITLSDWIATSSPARFVLPAGQYDLVVEKLGYTMHTDTITVEKNKTNEHVIRLQPSTNGIVIVKADPVDSRISLDGKTVTNNPARFELPAGQFNLVVGRPGYMTHTATIAVEKNKTNEQVITLEPPVNPDPQHFVWILPGTFTMGSLSTEKNRSANEDPQMQVTISKGFWMSKYETTQAEYLAVMGTNPSQLLGDTNRPVENVTWYDATNYCGKLTMREREAGRLPSGYEYRLPTEAEWEYACRAGTTTATAYGDSLSSAQANFNGNFPYGGAAKGPSLITTTKVGSYAPNAWGLYDMHGNVWEWCLDWYGTYPGGSVTDPRGPTTGSRRVMRGGGQGGYGRGCRSASRNSNGPVNRFSGAGFRPVLALVL